MNTQPPNRTQGTKADYRRRADQLRRRVARLRGLKEEQVLPIHLVEHLQAMGDSQAPTPGAPPRQPGKSTIAGESRSGAESPSPAVGSRAAIAKATFRQYKAALMAYFQEVLDDPQTTRYEGQLIESAIEKLKKTSQGRYAKRGATGSALKAKKFQDVEYRAVLAAVDQGIRDQHHWAVALKTYLQANRLVGLRPIEWENASLRPIEPGRSDLALVVRNAKTTNGRGNGEVRTLLLPGLSEEDLAALHDMVRLVEGVQLGEIRGLDISDAAREQAKSKQKQVLRSLSFAEFHKALRSYLHKITRELWPPSPRRTQWPTLYSLRHQIAADAKHAGGSRAEVAALLGHGSDATAGQHYGRRVSGQRPLGVKAAPEHVGTVRARAKSFVPRPRRDQ